MLSMISGYLLRDQAALGKTNERSAAAYPIGFADVTATASQVHSSWLAP